MEKDELRKEPLKPTDKAKQIYDRAKSFVGGFLRPNDPNKKPAPLQRDKLKELLDRIDKTNKHIDLISLPFEVQSEFQTCVRHLATEGFHDGVVGVRSESHKAYAALHADDLYLRYASNLAEQEQVISGKIDSKCKVVADRMKQFKTHHDYQDYLQHYYKFNERGNSLWEFFIYLICYLVIFVADIPLAAEMLKYLFDVNINDPAFSFWTIGKHLNVILMAIGLGFSSIYIKYCYDEFIGKKYGHSVISKKKLEELLGEDGSTPKGLGKEEKKWMRWHNNIVRALKIGILVFTLLTITILGIFRGYAWSQMSDITGEVQIPMWLISCTMIFITLLFSIVSGVCLSLSLNALTNYKRLKNSKKEAADLQKSYQDENDELANLKGKKAYVDYSIKQNGDGSKWRENIFNWLISYYIMGYDDGYTDPGFFMQELDFFDRVLLWRKQAAARRINTHVNK